MVDGNGHLAWFKMICLYVIYKLLKCLIMILLVQGLGPYHIVYHHAFGLD